MTLPAFRLERPRTVEEAVRILAAHGPDALVLAGGTDVVPNLQMRLFAPRVVVDIKPVRALAGIDFSPRDGLRLGALTTLTDILRAPLVREKFSVLAGAVASIAGPLQRNMGTLGGNLCLETRCVWYNQSAFWRQALGGCLKLPVAAPGAAPGEPICHVAPGGRRCWAVWSGDAAPALLALDADVELVGPGGTRRVPLRDFYRNDGMDRIALARDELLTAVQVPARAAGRRGVYHKLRRRSSIDYPLAGVAVALELDAGGACREARVAITGMNPAPRLVPEAAAELVGQPFAPERVARVARAVVRTAKPLTTSASTPVYRRHMLQVFTRRALEEAWRKPDGG